MNTTLNALWRNARRRSAMFAIIAALPWALLAVAVSLLTWGPRAATGICVLAASGTLLWAWQTQRRLHRHWLIATLNDDRALQDSADLLLADGAQLNPLQRQQQLRMQAVLARRQTPLPVPPHWNRQRLSWLFCTVLLLAVVVVPRWLASSQPEVGNRRGHAPQAGTAEAGIPVLKNTRLTITAPGYTGQPVREQGLLDAKAPQDSRLHWQLQFDPQPQSVTLQFHDGRTLELRRDGAHWQAHSVLERSLLYRVVTVPAQADNRLHRLDAIADRPPQIRVLQPERTLTLAEPRQRQWSLQFEASDDYAVAAQAQLKITVAQGSGENITFREQTLELAGSGEPTLRRFTRTLDLGALGVGPGDDLIAQLSVRDNHAPTPQIARSASLILRMPTEQEQQTSDLEGAIKKVMPAYFRSQRQIIIDAEALLKQRARLDADSFVKRADSIGVDQRILRLRYGQFLGEESEGEPKPPPTSDTKTDGGKTAHDDHHDDDGHDHGHDHGDAEGGGTPAFGSSSDVLAEYGHTHDHAEAATLLDPRTRATLKAALDQMWRSEGELRQGRPEQALPYAYKALAFIKQVQQAERIYLARVGPELPPIDEGRRMGGDRNGIEPARAPLPRVPFNDDPAMQVWQQLGSDTNEAEIDLAGLSRWLGDNGQRLADPLALIAAVEELRAAPSNPALRQQLRARLWSALRRPPPQVVRRPADDAVGQRYLRALQTESR